MRDHPLPRRREGGTADNHDGLCDWCREPIGRARRARFNGAVGHEACARHAYEAIAGEGAVPWPPRQAREQAAARAAERVLARDLARYRRDRGIIP